MRRAAAPPVACCSSVRACGLAGVQVSPDGVKVSFACVTACVCVCVCALTVAQACSCRDTRTVRGGLAVLALVSYKKLVAVLCLEAASRARVAPGFNVRFNANGNTSAERASQSCSEVDPPRRRRHQHRALTVPHRNLVERAVFDLDVLWPGYHCAGPPVLPLTGGHPHRPRRVASTVGRVLGYGVRSVERDDGCHEHGAIGKQVLVVAIGALVCELRPVYGTTARRLFR